MIESGVIWGLDIPENYIFYGLCATEITYERVRRLISESIGVRVCDTTCVIFYEEVTSSYKNSFPYWKAPEIQERIYSSWDLLIKKILRTYQTQKYIHFAFSGIDYYFLISDAAAAGINDTFIGIYDSEFIFSAQKAENALKRLLSLSFGEENERDYVLSLKIRDRREAIYSSWQRVIEEVIKASQNCSLCHFSVTCGERKKNFLIGM